MYGGGLVHAHPLAYVFGSVVDYDMQAVAALGGGIGSIENI